MGKAIPLSQDVGIPSWLLDVFWSPRLVLGCCSDFESVAPLPPGFGLVAGRA